MTAARGPVVDASPGTAARPLAVKVTGVSRRFVVRRPGRRSTRAVVDALTDVDLDIPEGARFGVVGESGSGKTTLMRLIAALDRPTSGRIAVDGIDITGRSERELGPLRRTLQVVFQDPMGSLDPRMRVGTIVAEPLQAARAARRTVPGGDVANDITAAVRTALERVGIGPDAIRRYPHEFSGGQRQRISIARAIVARPKILIADEAVSALDVTVRAQILELIDDLARAQRLTLIFVSHDLSVVRRVCDHVAVLRAGRVVETGPTDRIYTAPREQYTRELLAAVPTLSRSLQAARARSTARAAQGVPGGQEQAHGRR